MRRIVYVLLGAIVVQGSAQAEPPILDMQSDAVAFIEQFTKAPDRKAYAQHCDDKTIIIDHVPPYVFSGPTACEDEWDAVIAWTEKNGIAVADYGSLQPPVFADAHGDLLYVVFPATASLSHNGKALIERGTWTFVVRRHGDSWRIGSMTWSTLGFEERAPVAP